MKNFVLLKNSVTANSRYTLLYKGEDFLPFKSTIINLQRCGHAENTIEQYAGHIARFLDYLFEALLIDNTADAAKVLDLITSYREYLLFGSESDNKLVKEVAIRLGKKNRTNPNSLIPIKAAIERFLIVTEASSDDKKIFDNQFSLEGRARSDREIKVLKKLGYKDSFTVAAKFVGATNFSIFGRMGHSSAIKKNHDVSLTDVQSLISFANSHRDKCIYNALIGSGCRMHEVLQLRLEDIDFNSRQFNIFSPFNRDLGSITEAESIKLAWKGRATEKTFLIEPFRSQFFSSLESYLKRERDNCKRNTFLFQKKRGSRPLFTRSRQSTAESFMELKIISGLNVKGFTGHSLRGIYASYLLNEIPTEHGYGLPLSTVQALLGHASPKATLRYAKLDIDKLNLLYESKGAFDIRSVGCKGSSSE